MTAISDQSTIDGAWGFVIAAALIAVALLVAWSTDRRTKTSRAASGGPSNTEAARLTNPCPQRRCTSVARVVVATQVGLREVCHGCAEEGCARYGWERVS